MPSKYQNLIIHRFHIFILIFKHLHTIFNYIKIDVLDILIQKFISYLCIYCIPDSFIIYFYTSYKFLLYAITCYFGIIRFFQASSIKPDQSWVQSIKK